MKIVITGHTDRLGLALYNHLTNAGHEVIGLSRRNGYNVREKFHEIVAIAEGADCFFNNVHLGTSQAEFIKALAGKTKIVTSGSMSADYAHTGKAYNIDKRTIENTHIAAKKRIMMPMLLLKMCYLEDYPEKNGISYNTVLDAVDFWFKNPRVSIISFENDPLVYGL